ncbi:MAG TPA: hypothetical protein PK156_12225, partial [Polyangium sp.]|nr:hypothetical protein [Polyangium sp.]
QKSASLEPGFNNALIEIYSNEYTSMGSHCDQALDLADGSYIAIFSHYKYPERVQAPRKLIVESKSPGGKTFEIPLMHNSIVVFSTDTNRRFRHKIVLDRASQAPENEWLGITFRTSKTHVHIQDERPCLPDGTPLTLASDDERREFFQMRRRENQEMDFRYPVVSYTLSPSDRMMPAL